MSRGDRAPFIILLVVGAAALTVEAAWLSMGPRLELGQPINKSLIIAWAIRTTLLAVPFAFFVLSAMKARSVRGRLIGTALALTILVLNLVGLWDVHSEMEDPGAASIGLGFMSLVQWLLMPTSVVGRLLINRPGKPSNAG